MKKLPELTEIKQHLSVIERLDIDDSQTTKKNDEIQDSTDLRLSYIANIIKNKKKAGKNIDELREAHFVEVKSLLQKTVQDSYLNGKSYVGKSNKIFVPLTVEDVQEMEELVDKFEARFWGIIENAELDTKVKEFLGSLLADFVSMLVSDMVTDVINKASLKTLKQNQQFTQTLLQISKKGTFTFDDTLQVMFVSRRDDRVCPICEPLDGKKYDIDDSSKPNIPEDTHPRCRCRYLEVRNNKTING